MKHGEYAKQEAQIIIEAASVVEWSIEGPSWEGHSCYLTLSNSNLHVQMEITGRRLQTAHEEWVVRARNTTTDRVLDEKLCITAFGAGGFINNFVHRSVNQHENPVAQEVCVHLNEKWPHMKWRCVALSGGIEIYSELGLSVTLEQEPSASWTASARWRVTFMGQEGPNYYLVASTSREWATPFNAVEVTVEKALIAVSEITENGFKFVDAALRDKG